MVAKIPFHKKVFNWIQVHVTATVLSLLISAIGLSITLYSRQYDPSVEESIHKALSVQKKN